MLAVIIIMWRIHPPKHLITSQQRLLVGLRQKLWHFAPNLCALTSSTQKTLFFLSWELHLQLSFIKKVIHCRVPDTSRWGGAEVQLLRTNVWGLLSWEIPLKWGYGGQNERKQPKGAPDWKELKTGGHMSHVHLLNKRRLLFHFPVLAGWRLFSVFAQWSPCIST